MDEKINRAQKKLQVRQTILDAAAHEFETRGFINTSVSNIMHESKLGVGTFYNYFESKEDILRTLAKNLFKVVEDSIRLKANENYSSSELLEMCCMSTAQLIDENRFILPLFTSAGGYSDKPEYSRSISPEFKYIFAEIILRGQERGEFRRDIPTDLISEMFHSIYQVAAFSKIDIPFQENIRLKIKILLDGIIRRVADD